MRRRKTPSSASRSPPSALATSEGEARRHRADASGRGSGRAEGRASYRASHVLPGIRTGPTPSQKPMAVPSESPSASHLRARASVSASLHCARRQAADHSALSPPPALWSEAREPADAHRSLASRSLRASASQKASFPALSLGAFALSRGLASSLAPVLRYSAMIAS